MATHPEIELISRDRGGDYAAAARKAAPHATQTADRFHLYKNLCEALEGVLARHLADHRRGMAEKVSATPLGGRTIPVAAETESKGSRRVPGEARGTSCPIPASYRLTQARLLTANHCRPGGSSPFHCLALIALWYVSRTATAPSQDRS